MTARSFAELRDALYEHSPESKERVMALVAEIAPDVEPWQLALLANHLDDPLFLVSPTSPVVQCLWCGAQATCTGHVVWRDTDNEVVWSRAVPACRDCAEANR